MVRSVSDSWVFEPSSPFPLRAAEPQHVHHRVARSGNAPLNGAASPASSASSYSATLPPETRRALTAAVALELQKLHGGNTVLDWLEAEILVEGVLTPFTAEIAESAEKGVWSGE